MIKVRREVVLKINFRHGAIISDQQDHFKMRKKVIFLTRSPMKYFNKVLSSMNSLSRFICRIKTYSEIKFDFFGLQARRVQYCLFFLLNYKDSLFNFDVDGKLLDQQLDLVFYFYQDIHDMLNRNWLGVFYKN